MKMKTLIFLLAVLATPLAAQERRLTSTEVEQGFFDTTIPNAGSLSDPVAIGRACTPVAVIMPDTWTTASLTFRASVGGVTPVDLFDGGSPVEVAAAASRYIVLEANIFFTTRVVQIRSGTAAAPVNQGAARVIRVVCR